MFTVSFWKSAAERALKTGAQFAATTIGTNFLDWTSLDAGKIAVASGLAALVSLLMSIGSAKVGPTKYDPSLV